MQFSTMILGEEQEAGFCLHQEIKWKDFPFSYKSLWVKGSIPTNKIGDKEKQMKSSLTAWNNNSNLPT